MNISLISAARSSISCRTFLRNDSLLICGNLILEFVGGAGVLKHRSPGAVSDLSTLWPRRLGWKNSLSFSRHSLLVCLEVHGDGEHRQLVVARVRSLQLF